MVINYKENREAGEATVAEVERMGRKALLVQCDVADSAAVESMVKKAEAAFGKVDILVNNAGGGIAKTADQLTDADYDKVFNINVRAYVAAVRPPCRA